MTAFINWPALAIDHAITCDDSDGLPVLSFSENYDKEFFALVRRLPNETTLWRAISLQMHARETPPPSRGILGGMTMEKTYDQAPKDPSPKNGKTRNETEN
jgi:hypothetical protein